jgi:hypothetical protein
MGLPPSVRTVAIRAPSAIRLRSVLWLLFTTLLHFLRLEIVPIGFCQSRCIPDVRLPLLGHCVLINTLVTGNDHVQLVDPLISPVEASLAVLLRSVLRDQLDGRGEVLFG